MSEIYQKLSVVRLSEADFELLNDEWSSLLQKSAANALFMSWPWLYSWWDIWNKRLGLELLLFAVYDQEKELVGLGPFYRHYYSTPVGFKVNRLHFLGNAWRIAPTVRTEYNGLIARRGLEEEVRQSLLSELSGHEWDELVLCDSETEELRTWERELYKGGHKVRIMFRQVDAGIRIDSQGSFDHWLARLGKNTRLKVFNRRVYLAHRGTLELAPVTHAEHSAFLDQLNAFHKRRWGRACFDVQAVQFHQKLLARLGPEQSLESSRLILNGQVISVLYDIRADGITYNLQSGYEENFDPKVSLGSLHLGYGIQESFTDTKSKGYDLLAGKGKNTFYKGHLNGETVHFSTVQFVRNPFLKVVYQYQARLPQRLRRFLNSLFRL